MPNELTVRFELFVDDFDRSVAFYTSALGFRLERRESNYASLRNGAVTIGLGLVGQLPRSGGGAGFTQSRLADDRGGGVEIVLETGDLAGMYEQVITTGYELAEPMTARPWGLSDFRLVDPDGYYLRVTERG